MERDYGEEHDATAGMPSRDALLAQLGLQASDPMVGSVRGVDFGEYINGGTYGKVYTAWMSHAPQQQPPQQDGKEDGAAVPADALVAVKQFALLYDTAERAAQTERRMPGIAMEIRVLMTAADKPMDGQQPVGLARAHRVVLVEHHRPQCIYLWVCLDLGDGGSLHQALRAAAVAEEEQSTEHAVVTENNEDHRKSRRKKSKSKSKSKSRGSSNDNLDDAEGSVSAYMRRAAACAARAIHLRWDVAVGICTQLARALTVLHDEVNVVHGDMKSNNVVLVRRQQRNDDDNSNDGTNNNGSTCMFDALLVDYGGAQQLSRVAHGTPRTRTGTPRWMAPELLDPAGPVHPSAASDVYALGVVLWEVVTGCTPWAAQPPDRDGGEAAARVREAIWRGEIVLPWTPRPRFADAHPVQVEGMRRVVYQCLQHDPAMRPSAAEVAAMISHVQDGT